MRGGDWKEVKKGAGRYLSHKEPEIHSKDYLFFFLFFSECDDKPLKILKHRS